MFEIGRHSIETRYGDFQLMGHLFGDNQQVALTLISNRRTENGEASDPWLIRVQYGCVNATAFGAIDCDCGAQIESALAQISNYGRGLFLYFRDHEAFGLGIAEKIRVVATEKARHLSFEDVLRLEKSALPHVNVLWTVPQILRDAGIDPSTNFVLLSSSEEKLRLLRDAGINIVEARAIGARV